MFRVVSAIAIVVSLTACASDAPSKQGVRIVEKRRTCTVTTAPISKAEFCATPKACPAITTCGEAYFRYTACSELVRDGGVAGQMNGIPCENVCGKTALAMAAKIRGEGPFLLPMRTSTVCNPA
jgi:hypothetical protein